MNLSAEAVRSVYCEVTSTLGGSTSGWMRIAKLDVSNCPQGFKRKTINSVIACIRFESRAGCAEIHYSSYNFKYSNISGAVRAIRVGTMDGFNNFHGSTFRSVNNNNVKDNYLDGVSITTATKHIWSFAGGCSCGEITNPNKPRFVRKDYICDSNSQLWESQQCNNLDSSWFFKRLTPITADIAVRVCRDQAQYDEDITLTALELYIQ